MDSFNKLAAIGYRAVQVQWVDPNVPDAAVAQALAEAGLHCLSVQDRFEAVEANLARFMSACTLWGGNSICVSGIPEAWRTRAGLGSFAAALAKMADQLRKHGLTISFHPLATDYTCLPNDSAVDRLFDLAPRDLRLTLCAYHVVRAGLSPEAWLRRHQGRVDAVHFKDYSLQADGAPVLMPVGQGLIQWQPIIEVCRQTNVPWILAEQETWQKDAFICAQESYAALRSWGLTPDLN